MKQLTIQSRTIKFFYFFTSFLLAFYLLVPQFANAQVRLPVGGVGSVADPGLEDDWTGGNGKIYYTNGNVGIGTSVPAPGSRLHLYGQDQQFMRVTSTGGTEFSNTLSSIELERILSNGSSLSWKLINQENFLIRRDNTTILNIGEDEAQIGGPQNRIPFHIWGKSLAKSGSNISGGALLVASHAGLPSNTKILKVDGNSLETDTDLHLNIISGQDVDLVRGGGNLGIGGSPSGTAKVAIRSEGMHLRMLNTSESGGGAHQWFMGVSDANWLVGEGKLVFSNSNNSANATMVMTEAGNVGIGTTTPSKTLQVDGTTSTKVLEITGGADLAEPFDIEGGILARPGMVVSIDPWKAGGLRISSQKNDKKVAGIISGAGNIQPGMIMGQDGSIASGQYPVALTGRVYCLVDTKYGKVSAGDLLTTSNTPGHAMKVEDHHVAQGAIIGKAMTSLEEGKGLVLVLVSLQ